MSSQLTSPPVHQPEPPEKPKGIDLSASQVVGGALAAMTAAALGSRLGVAGTVIGAAVASIVAAIGGSVYTASIRASREHVRTVFVRRPSGRTDATAPTTLETATAVSEPSEPMALDPAPASTPTARTTRSWSWKTAAVGALAAFVLAAAAVTGFEVFTGSALSGGQGTTFTQVSKDATGGAATRDSSSTEPSDSPSADPSASASPDASASADPTPSASASASDEPTPSATPSESASTDPTPSASPSASDPSASAGADTSGTDAG